MGKFIFSSKAKTLRELQGNLNVFEIPAFDSFTVKDLQTKGLKTVTSDIKKKFNGCRLAVRSSAVSEDTIESSGAGKFDTVLGVNASNEAEVLSAINEVLQSYSTNDPRHEIIIQKYISDISMSGVVFTRDINTGAPYFVVNFDDITGSTNSVTSGDGEHSNQAIYIRRNATGSIKSPRFKILIQAIEEVMRFVQSDSVDIEFALTKNLVPVLFQVRPITTIASWQNNFDQKVTAKLEKLKTDINKYTHCSTGHGSVISPPVFSQMSDWNPAEIIGNIPRPLAFSLYQLLITNKVWADARTDIGYSQCDDIDLVKNMAGHPFVNVKSSLQSLLPKKIPVFIRKKLVAHFLNRLAQNPVLHDKIEFEIIPNVYTPDISDQLKTQIGNVLTEKELVVVKNALKDVTLSMIKGPSSIDKYMTKISELEKYTFENQKFCYTDLLTLIQLCKEGTFAFAALARHGFAGVSMIKALVSLGAVDPNRVEDFYKGFSTISGDFVNDCSRLAQGKISEKVFLQRYGHLRPGTYDVLSPRYDQMDISLFCRDQNGVVGKNEKLFELSQEEINKIDAAIATVGLNDLTAEDLITYCKRAVQSREYGKFIFTRFVSEIIESVIQYGKDVGLNKEELSFLEIHDILGNMSGEVSREDLKAQIQQNMEDYKLALCLKLPPLLSKSNEIDVVPFQASRPNFITKKTVTAPIVQLSIQTLTIQATEGLSGNVILIENADPGYDWLFSFEIAGLITRYGGANSHMAIRCSEHDIPAAIGCGDHYYRNLSSASLISLDCEEKKISIIK